MSAGRKRKVQLLAAGVLLALFAAVITVLLRPAYRNYIEKDHWETCMKARFVLLDRYNTAIFAMAAEGITEDEIDFEQLMQDTAMRLYDTPVEDGKMAGLCRSGGTWILKMDEETHRVEVVCDCPYHGSYWLGEGSFFNRGY